MTVKTTLRVATYNINGINSRLHVLLRWLEEFQPDVVGLQELKSTDEAFPGEGHRSGAIVDLAWPEELEWRGDPRRVGEPVETVAASPATRTTRQSRYIEAAVYGISIGNLYLPNGNPWPGPKFDYKLGWMDRLMRCEAAARQRVPAMLTGDFNVIPTDQDVYKPERWAKDAPFPAGPGEIRGAGGAGMDRRPSQPSPG